MTSAPTAPKCPICGEPTQRETRPFCSRRCRNIDFARWMTGGYVIAGSREDDAQDELRGAENSAENGTSQRDTKDSSDAG